MRHTIMAMQESTENSTDCRQYIYTHTTTLATTGYFACEPEFDVSFPHAAVLLAERPNDNYLRLHLLNRLNAMDSESLRRLARICLEPESLTDKNWTEADASMLAELLLHCAQHNQVAKKILQPYLSRLAGNDETAAPDLISGAANSVSSWSGYFRNGFFYLRDMTHGDPPQASMPCSAQDIAKALEDMRHNGCVLKNVHSRLRECADENENIIPAAETAAIALDRLEKANILCGPEMRHEASLSPIALLRAWRIDARTNNGRHNHHLRGETNAYGRGLSLAGARASCLMEIVERVCAYPEVRPGGAHGHGAIGDNSLLFASWRNLRAKDLTLYHPLPVENDWREIPVHWLHGMDSQGKAIWVPAQSVFLFLNLDEKQIFHNFGSTGLATGSTAQQAKLAALLEVIERDAQATTPFCLRDCFQAASQDRIIQSLLDDYRARKIFVGFQDITTDIGVPVYRCFVRGKNGEVAQATGAALTGKKAALSALTETPWPYSWATPAPFGKPSLRPEQPLPTRVLETLPDFNLCTAKANLRLVEETLEAMGRSPIYVNIGRAYLGFPVVRAFIPGLEPLGDYDDILLPGPRLLARWLYMRNETGSFL